MGVAGSGKTTIGRLVAHNLACPYFEADDFHSPENKAKMGQGIPLNDRDREPWLAAIRAKIDECRAAGQSAVFTCSALKESYRIKLGIGSSNTILIHLTGDKATLLSRLNSRQGHYMKPEMVHNQVDTLELPASALTFDITRTPNEITASIIEQVKRLP